MTKSRYPTRSFRSCRPAVVLVLTLIVLTVLSVVTAVLSAQITQVKRRLEYRIDYQQARYACDSALKYMLTVLPEKNFTPVSREGLPDFSDLYWMDRAAYEQYIRYWLQTAEEDKINKVLKEEDTANTKTVELPDNPALAWADALKIILAKMESDPNEFESRDAAPVEEDFRSIDPNRIEVPGPYGAPWPWVMEPIELEIGSARVRIMIEDENAKLPLVWGMLPGEVPEAAITTFCQVMRMDKDEIESLLEELKEINKIKPFTMDPQPILVKARTSAARTNAAKRTQANRVRTTRGRTAAGAATSQPAAKDELRPAIANAADFAKLLHSSLLREEYLARPLPDTGERVESPLTYLSLWGAQEVNINTAPRHVLEAVFTFGGKEVEIADAIIKRRQEKPYRSLKELTDELYLYKVEIERASKYFTTQSVFFKIRVECFSGIARCTAVATAFKDRKTVEKLAILYSQ